MTLTQLQADVYRRLGFSSSPPSEVSTRITAYLNEAQQDIISDSGMAYLLNDLLPVTTVANQQQYGLWIGGAKVKRIAESTRNYGLVEMSYDVYRNIWANAGTGSGTPAYWVNMGIHGGIPGSKTGTADGPADASRLFVDSTSAGDTGTAYLEGFRANGYPFTETLVMTGATAVGTTLTDIKTVTKFWLSTAAVGTVTLVEDAEGGTVLATIPIGQANCKVVVIAFAPTPSAALDYYVEFQRDVSDMAIATDEPCISKRFHRILAIGARMKEYEYRGDMDRYTIAKGEWNEVMRDLRNFVYAATAGTPNLRPGVIPVDIARMRLTNY